MKPDPPRAPLSPLGESLRRAVERVPGAIGAVLTDDEGEPVDQFALGPSLDVQIAGAQWGVVLGAVRASLGRLRAGEAKLLVLECARMQVLIRPLEDGYYAVLLLDTRAPLGLALDALEKATRELRVQM